MKSIFAIFLVMALGVSSAQGTEILWLKLNSSFSYRDLSTVCSNKNYPATLYFGAEVEGVEIKKAVFRDSLNSTASSKITLTTEEIKDLALYKDKYDQLWLKTALMKSRLLNWMFFEAGGSMLSSCKPSQVLASIDPNSFSFGFEIEATSEMAESNFAKFRGKLKDGAAYEAELQFSQKPYQFYQMDESFLDGYPTPPWTRSVSAMGSSFSRPSAQSLCQSDARSKVRRLETTCRTNGGTPSSNHPFCSICNQLGSQWRCNESVRVRCS